MNLRNRIRISDEPHANALNDILFILLFFFLIVSTMANPNVIKLTLPRVKSEQKSKQSIVISIDSAQKVFIGTHPVVIDSLSGALANLVAKSPKDTAAVVVNADKKAAWGSVAEVMKVVRAQNLKVVMAVENK